MAKYLKKVIATAVALALGVNAMIVFAADTTEPSDVEGLVAYPGDGEVTLQWDPATDDTAVTGYYIYSGLSSVTDDGGSYTFGSTDAGDVTSYTMEGLSNDVTYYFAVTGYDEAGNESINYSFEVEATPESADTGDFSSPTISDAEALSNTLVEVTFSEDLVLPDDEASAFSIEASDGTALEVLDAYLSEEDASVVFLVTSVQTAGAQYLITAGIDISDEAGNPIISGTSDTADFTGSSVETAEEEEEEPVVEEEEETTSDSDFTVEEVEATETNELTITLSQDLNYLDAEYFTVASAEDASNEVAVESAEFDTDENGEDIMNVVILTLEEDLDAGFEYVLSLSDELLNEEGSSLDEDSMELEFLAKTIDLADVIAPEDITNLLASIEGEDGLVLNWTASLNTAGDLAKYLVYMSTDGGSTWAEAVEVASSLTTKNFGLLETGKTYTFKVTAVDENGNESSGVLTTIELPETGPGMVAMLGLSLIGGAYAARRKRNEI